MNDGKFALIEEPLDDPLPKDDPLQFFTTSIQWPLGTSPVETVPTSLELTY